MTASRTSDSRWASEARKTAARSRRRARSLARQARSCRSKSAIMTWLVRPSSTGTSANAPTP